MARGAERTWVFQQENDDPAGWGGCFRTDPAAFRGSHAVRWTGISPRKEADPLEK